jgi:hypothetical protein
MNNFSAELIPLISKNNPAFHTAKVAAYDKLSLEILIEGKKLKAKKAFSCLVEPQINDTVICTSDEKGMYYILAILERKDNKRINISFPSDAELNSDNGFININSSKSASIISKKINLFSDKAVYKSKEATVAIDEITASGNEIQAGYKTIKTAADLISTFSRQVTEKFKTYVRSSKNDIVKSDHMTRKSEGLYSVDSKHTIMKSKKSTKIDGDKILMG